MTSTVAKPTPKYDSDIEGAVGSAKALRAAIWRHTHDVFSVGAYVPEDGAPAGLDGLVKASVGSESLAISVVRPGTHFGAPANGPGESRKVRVVVQDVDCLVAAERLARAGMPPLVMDAGSRRHFGGGYQNGSRAQEEELCRRTSLALQCDCGLGWQRSHFYPLPAASAIHVPKTQVIRHGADLGYRLMAQPFECGVGIVAAYNKPKLDASGQAIVGQAAKDTREMIRSFFAAAALHGYRSVVCIAVGCGAFQNPAVHVAQLFAEVLQLPEVQASCVEEACFAVLDDHNAFHKFNPDGNFAAFARTLSRAAGATVLSRDGTDVTASVRADPKALMSAGSATLQKPPNAAEALVPGRVPVGAAVVQPAKKKKNPANATRTRKPALAMDEDEVIDVDALSDEVDADGDA